MPSAAFLIYSGIMPLVKTFLTILAGYALVKLGMFPLAASRGASEVTMNMALPALIFASVIPAFTPSNISALGPLFLVSFIYQAIGFLCGFIVREICYVPRNFWQGIIIMTGMSNWGNLPNAVVLSITQQAPFNPATDPALGVSYVSIFIVSYVLLFWGEAAEVRISWKEKPIGSLITRYILRQEVPESFVTVAASKAKDVEQSISEKEKGTSADTSVRLVSGEEPPSHAINDANVDPDIQLARRTSHLSTTTAPPAHARRLSAVPSAVTPVSPPTTGQSEHDVKLDAQTVVSHSATLNMPTHLQKIGRLLRPLLSPMTCAFVVSVPIALVQPLKALFVDVSATGGPSFKGPDGRPPLAFVIDTANFLGGIAVPLGLILLGASFARIKIPRPLSRLPITAIVLTTAAKMVVLPVIGVLLVQAMTTAGLVDKNAKALRFVMMFLSGTPSAVNQLIVASLYSPDGNTDTLAAFLLVQYIFMFFSSAALTAVALLLL